MLPVQPREPRLGRALLAGGTVAGGPAIRRRDRRGANRALRFREGGKRSAQPRARGWSRDRGQRAPRAPPAPSARCACALAGLAKGTRPLPRPALFCWGVSAKVRRDGHPRSAHLPARALCQHPRQTFSASSGTRRLEYSPELAQVHAVHTLWPQQHEAHGVLQGTDSASDWLCNLSRASLENQSPGLELGVPKLTIHSSKEG